MVSPTLWKTYKYFVCRVKDGIAFNAFCGKTNSKGWIGSPKCSPYSRVIPAKGMWFCLIREHEWAHGKPPIFNYWSPWLPGLSLAGWGSVLQGPSHSAMLPEVTRASWFSDRVCVHMRMCVCLCQVQYPPYPVKTFFSGWHATGRFKKHFQNICKPKWLQIFEQTDMKGRRPSQSRSRKAVWAPARLVKWAIPHEFPNIFKCTFLIWSSSCVFTPPPK